MTTASRMALMAVAAGLLAACAQQPAYPPQTVVLVPDRDGKVGTVMVTGSEGSTTLNQPYAAARGDAAGKIEQRAASEGEVKTTFAGAIAAQPMRPVSFLLYFQEGTDEYTPESKEAFEKVFAEVARRKVAEIAIIGHTDTVGKLEFNDALSLKRAERVRKDFTDRGVPPVAVNVAGRGEREPIVPTADEVTEARNRRVEINVR
jgi:outer membrane protein OmpA-like peptidoglycan-associated protein